MELKYSVLNSKTGMYLCSGEQGTIWSSSPCPWYIARYDYNIATEVAKALTLTLGKLCVVKEAMEII